MKLSSPAFAHGQPIPQVHTCEGADLSVPLAWSDPPAATQSLALFCDDPDAPAGTWHHWAIYDMPSDLRELPEGIAGDEKTPFGRQAINDFKRIGYGGPCPPKGHGTHHYHFRLLALSVPRLNLSARVRCIDAAAAAEPCILAEAELVGTCSR